METTQIKERPILFSGPLVRAILAGEKTQTRRVIKPPLDMFGEPIKLEGITRDYIGGPWYGWHHTHTDEAEYESLRCPYGGPGDRLYVREAWRTFAAPIACPDGSVEDPCVGIQYRADDELTFHDFSEPGTLDTETLHRYGRQYEADMEGPGKPRWRPSIHMPRWASRLTLEVTGVRVERVQDIDEFDAEAEGVEPVLTYGGWNADGATGFSGSSYVSAFEELWDKINGPRGYGWDSNPLVWVVDFRVIPQGEAAE